MRSVYVPQSRTELAGTTSPTGTAAANQISPPFSVEMAWTCRSTKLPKVPCTALGYQLAMCKMRGVEAGSAAMGTKGRKDLVKH